MTSLILRFLTPVIATLMALFAVLVLFKGHNAPGGGFIGGLIAAAALTIFGFMATPKAIRQALPLSPLSAAAFGLLLAALSGLLSWFSGQPYLTGLWAYPFGKDGFAISTPMLFDIGVWLVVAGVVAEIALMLEQTRDTDRSDG